ncbi:MAG: RagB/SusD family nutrient uptake outer membrane protein [Mangrovibacterium sp.]
MEVESTTSITIDQYYNTEARIFEALVAAYDPLSWCDYVWGTYSPYEMVSDIMGDDMYVGGADKNDMANFHRMANYEVQASGVGLNNWTAYYSGVNRANNVFKYMPYVQDISEDTKALYLAEAQTLRAFYYMRLWKLWGNIPYYDVNLEFPYTAPQLTADVVYANIVAELEAVLDNTVLPMRATAADYGRVTFAMAAMVYTETVMYQNDDTKYGKALGYLNEVISSGQYDLVDDYASIWEESGEWSEESIFEINYFRVNAARSWDNPMGDGGSVFPRFIGINEMNDPSGKYGSGWGFGPIRTEAYEMFADTDTRRDASILNMETYAAETGATYTPRYQNTGYFLNKFVAQQSMNVGQVADGDLNFGNNTRIYRYSETLLYAAELLARGASGTGSAQSYLDDVRKRAGQASVSPTVDNILKERRLEFVGEGKRYWDLVRSGKAATTLIPNKYRTNSWTEAKKYLPIEQNEIDADPSLDQNLY